MNQPLSARDRQRLEMLFDRAADMPEGERADFVARECGDNAALRDQLSRLIAGLAGPDLPSVLEPAAPLQPGTKVGDYKLLERVGQGGMGEVYAAEQLAPVVRRVALKVIKRGMDSAQIVARFEAERQALARMAHSNIAQVYDGGTTEGGQPFFVMEFIAGDPITEFCDRRKLSTRERLELFLGICDGVQHAHLKGIIHRDLKPSNLLVMEQDGRAIAKIIDFGIARAVTGRLSERTLHTMLGQVVGTLDYMSPEQADPTAVDIDTRSDVYSLGVVLYQIICGLLPFGQSGTGVVGQLAFQREILEKDPPTPSSRLRRQTATATTLAPKHGTDGRSLIRQLAGDLDWICLKALEKNPARRYQSVAELAQDVRRHLVHEPVLAGRPGMLYRARKFVRRNRVTVAAMVLVLIVTWTGVVGIVAAQMELRKSERVANAVTWSFGIVGLEADAAKLWPPYPDKISDMEYWLGQANNVVVQLPQYREMLAELRESVRMVKPSAEPPDVGENKQRQIAALVSVIERSEQLASGLNAEDAIVTGQGWSVPRRLSFALKLETEFGKNGKHAAVWRRDLPEILRDHPGLEWPLETRMDLVPIGKSFEGHWEFAHLMTGEPAGRGPKPYLELELTDETGIVFVLIPGGTFEMGADATPGSVRFKHTVTLPPYLISKYEMTQAQWKRLTGRNPSSLGPAPGSIWEPEWLESYEDPSLLHPVEQVSWWDCNTWLPRAGLSLPSEAQWEYAARGETTTTWWSGDDVKSLQGNANLSDQYAKDHGATAGHARPLKGHRDGATMHAPVNDYGANGFGLHNVIGNVFEWCLDGYDEVFYGLDQEPDPVNHGVGEQPRVYRGGSFRSFPVGSAGRSHNPPGMKGYALGVRAARDIVPR